MHILSDYCDFSYSFFNKWSISSSHCLICTNRCVIHRKLGHIKMFPLREQCVKNTPLKISHLSKPVRCAVNNLYFPAISLFFHQPTPGPPVSDTFLSSIKLWGNNTDMELYTSSQTRDEGIISVIYLKSLL